MAQYSIEIHRHCSDLIRRWLRSASTSYLSFPWGWEFREGGLGGGGGRKLKFSVDKHSTSKKKKKKKKGKENEKEKRNWVKKADINTRSYLSDVYGSVDETSPQLYTPRTELIPRYLPARRLRRSGPEVSTRRPSIVCEWPWRSVPAVDGRENKKSLWRLRAV